jgi:hypothetical protein
MTKTSIPVPDLFRRRLVDGLPTTVGIRRLTQDESRLLFLRRPAESVKGWETIWGMYESSFTDAEGLAGGQVHECLLCPAAVLPKVLEKNGGFCPDCASHAGLKPFRDWLTKTEMRVSV